MIDVGSIYDKPINFLIGSGASYGLFPTLELGMKDQLDESYTIETLSSELGNENLLNALSAHYYITCIRPAQTFNPANLGKGDEIKMEVIENYRSFLRTVVSILASRSPRDPRCTVFTTNYDGCFQFAAESLLRRGSIDFVLNDGAVGFNRKVLQPRAFNSYLCRTGIFERSVTTVPQINLVHLHGSVYWSRAGEDVVVDYNNPPADLTSPELLHGISAFSNDLLNPEKRIDDLEINEDLSEDLTKFAAKYNKLPIVNPRKWKFHETVFEEHYYHMLRMLSYELEKPNAVLIVFGFSFADEHIVSLLKRSLANTSLKVFLCCFNENTAKVMQQKFSGFPNVELVVGEDPINFSRFNGDIFRVPDSNPSSSPEPAKEPAQ